MRVGQYRADNLVNSAFISHREGSEINWRPWTFLFKSSHLCNQYNFNVGENLLEILAISFARLSLKILQIYLKIKISMI